MNERECRRIVAERDGELCARCGVGGGLTLHHRRNRSQMPKIRHWEPSNCAMLCGDGARGCHGWVTANPAAASDEGWHVKPWQEPEHVPVLYRRSGLVNLHDDGSITYM